MRACRDLQRDIELARPRPARDRPSRPPPWSASAAQPSPAAISMSKRSPPATPPAVLTNTAGEPLAFRRGKAHAQRAGLMQDAAPRHAVARMRRRSAPRRGRGWPRRPNDVGLISVAAHPSRHSRPSRQNRSIGIYSAIWRLISVGSRLERSQAYFTAPRSITAKLSASSRAKSRYCSTSTMAMLPRLRR